MDGLALKTDAGHRLLARYRKTQNSRDLDQSVTHFQSASDLCPTDHPYRPAALFNLATAKFISCQADGRYFDLDIPISLFQDALDLRPADHPDRTVTQLHLAIALLSRFTKRGFQTDDLDEAIALQRESLALHPVGHTNRSTSLINLAYQLSSRFDHRGNDGDLDEAIALQRKALDLCPFGHTDRSASLINLAIALSSCFRHRGNDEDLDEAITLQMEALALCPVGHPHRSMSLNSLAGELFSRFHHRGNDEDLDEAIALQREALALRPVGHTSRSASLHDLADELSSRFRHRGNEEDLDKSIALYREALALLPVGHTDQPGFLNNLAAQLVSCFDHRGNNKDLDEAITLQREALALRQVGHTCRPGSLNNLAAQLYYRFRHRGNDEDLDEAIALQRESLALRLIGHTDRSASLNNLAAQLLSRFHHRGNDEDLDEAITLQRESLALRLVGHTDRSGSLNNLASQLASRFDHRGKDEDLDEAIALYREALALRPIGHTHRSMPLNNLAGQLFSRFRHRGNDEDLDEAIPLQREALALLPVGHTDRSGSLNNLAAQLLSRFNHRWNSEDLDEAITLQREALALFPVGHTDRFVSLNNLANGLSIRFKHQHDSKDLDESRENLRFALTLLTQYDPRQILVHRSLAEVYLSFHLSGLTCTGAGKNTDSLDATMHHLKTAANVVSGGLLSRLQASLSWVHHASEHSHSTQLDAYATSMQLLDAYVSVTASVSSRHNAMKEFPRTLAADAASCALRSGDVGRAVELLEQGRTIIWTQMTRLRTHLDILQTRGDHAMALIKRFRDLSSLLDKPPASHPDNITKVNVEAEATQYRRLVGGWNGTVEQIRKIEGFSRFLLPPVFSDLQDAARDGPIIVLIASRSSCDAIIIPHQQPPASIQLPTNFWKLAKLVVALREAVDKQAGPEEKPIALIKALRQLWEHVVGPVVEKLNLFAPRGSRIWWCPTSLFNFLPLHAASEYTEHGTSLSQQYISSYTPSLTALMKARGSHDRSSPVPFVAIGQDCPAGALSTLDGVEPELELVRSLLPPLPTVSFSKITSVDATKSRALCALRDNTWLHLACHGTQKLDKPFESAFLMRDEPLSLLDIAQTDLSRHQFAFLSACETAVGDFSTPDEVIHLAAGLQFAGVKSVIGTLWKVNDSTVERLVKAFYKNLCGDGKMNCKRAAWALHRAVQSLARDKEIPLNQRILFVHIGI
ncbi:CHAT domain-containing protein [Suillus bovinus]|uniref:CHAT domain-containing protein n=1 Tax=Suillus bovinus TaxID=48563 RepID=UPI001B87B20F|nr:CHAT domain-containing protein [Suillus bovinus]KAG2153457.1 CHAT domain-containing protein [Suillus bovinus]